MKLLTVSSKRQITLSKSDLDELVIQPGDKVLLQKQANGFYLSPAADSVVEEVGGVLRPYIARDKLNSTNDRMMDSTRKIVAKKLAQK